MEIYGIQNDGKEFKLGFTKGDTLYVPRDIKIHLFRNGCKTVESARNQKVSEWAIDKSIIDSLVSEGKIQFITIIADKYYSAKVIDFYHKGRIKEFHSFGVQYFLNETYFKVG